MPPTAWASTGHPAAIASTSASGAPSLSDGRSRRWLAASRAATFPTSPAKTQRFVTPSAAARASTADRSMPEPRKSSVASTPRRTRRARTSTATFCPFWPSNAPTWTSRKGGAGGAGESTKASAGRPSGITAIRSGATPAASSAAATAEETARKRFAARYFTRDRACLDGRKTTRRWTTSGRPEAAPLQTAAPCPRESPA